MSTSLVSRRLISGCRLRLSNFSRGHRDLGRHPLGAAGRENMATISSQRPMGPRHPFEEYTRMIVWNIERWGWISCVRPVGNDRLLELSLWSRLPDSPRKTRFVHQREKLFVLPCTSFFWFGEVLVSRFIITSDSLKAKYIESRSLSSRCPTFCYDVCSLLSIHMTWHRTPLDVPTAIFFTNRLHPFTSEFSSPRVGRWPVVHINYRLRPRSTALKMVTLFFLIKKHKPMKLDRPSMYILVKHTYQWTTDNSSSVWKCSMVWFCTVPRMITYCRTMVIRFPF